MGRTVAMLSQGMTGAPASAGGLAGQGQGMGPGFQSWLGGGVAAAQGLAGQGLVTGSGSTMCSQGMARTPTNAGGQASQTQGMQSWLGGGPGAAQGMVGQQQGLSAEYGTGQSPWMATGTGAPRGMVVANKNVGSTEQSDVCKDWLSKDGCRRGTSCRWSHPPGKGKVAGKKECSFWLDGKCKYSSDHCNRGSHTEGLQGTKPWTSKSNGDQQQNQPQGFRTAQAIAQSQGMAGAATQDTTAQLLQLQLQLQLLQAQQGGLVVPRP